MELHNDHLPSVSLCNSQGKPAIQSIKQFTVVLLCPPCHICDRSNPNLLWNPANAAIGGTMSNPKGLRPSASDPFAPLRKAAAARDCPTNGLPRASTADHPSSESKSKSSELGWPRWAKPRLSGVWPTFSAKPAKKFLRWPTLTKSTDQKTPIPTAPKTPAISRGLGDSGGAWLGDGCGSGSLMGVPRSWNRGERRASRGLRGLRSEGDPPPSKGRASAGDGHPSVAAWAGRTTRQSLSMVFNKMENENSY